MFFIGHRMVHFGGKNIPYIKRVPVINKGKDFTNNSKK